MVQRLLLSCFALSLLATGSADAAKRRGCPTKGGKTVAVQGGIRVYTVGNARQRDWFACSNKLHRRMTLTTEVDDEQDVVSFQMAGHFIVLNVVASGVDSVETDLELTDLKRGKSAAIF